ncbi:Glyoxalase/bleomycin resistance protein/dioxygenase [Kribbella flavida DSM 17836]|uniref:Glyoxalase/bleomycin resistance protein/dioxygenase n=1 Tax=Kribbella flavida (strain DSM 17836 / JCM 10339 / NBRC 14399) TaxID=479435 RepID=D2PMQ2_KRIFD|nr:VOC family protein [Kribbella flavida]ADB32604.1 Glyoxalase/bleomycin resistance protein/dioxygenase [Kribbella flavida DSM 17836]
MNGLNVQVTSVTIMAPDPRALAEFYARLLGRPVTTSEGPREGHPPEDGWAQLRAAEGTGEVTLNFEYEEQWAKPVWPAEKGAQNATQHLDIAVDDLEAATAHAIAQGAVLADFQPQDSVRVLLDPAGHPFCLFT